MIFKNDIEKVIMATIDFKTLLKLERTVSVSDTKNLSESQISIIEKVKDFGIDEIYFSTDGRISYPAIFLKKVKSFDPLTLKTIASIQQKSWNYQKVLFLYVYNDTEIRIYNCSEKPFVVTGKTDFDKELKKLEVDKVAATDKSAIDKLAAIFSSVAVDTGIIWTLPEACEIKKKINLQRRVDKYLVDSLVRTTSKLKDMGLSDITLIHKIFLRSLFLLYLEDRQATDAQFYNSIKEGAQSYFDILEDVDSTYKLYAALEYHFNGNVFSVSEEEKQLIKGEHLHLIKRCFINGYDGDGQTILFEDWRLFNFKIIQIELLSEIYERFLKESDIASKKKSGAFYTPSSLVELILNEKLPIEKKYTNYNVKILDPACGSGIFLVESYKRLVKRYENQTGKKLSDFEQLTKLLVENIFGIEINDQAIVVATFSLYLALLDNLDPKTLWQSKKLPYLINNPDKIPTNEQGNNLFCRDSIGTNSEIENISFDLVVGNPPFGTENKSKGVLLSPTTRQYCEKEKFAKEMVLPFLHKAVKFAPNGEIALICNTKLLTNTGSTYQNFRKWLFNECYVEKIYNFSILRNAPKDFGGQLFGSAIGPICIAFYRKEEPRQKSDRIIYYAPKTFVKSNLLEGVVIDITDVKYLPREECRKPNTKIWKIAMWGGMEDIKFLKYSISHHKTLEEYLNKNEFVYGVGFETTTPAKIENKDISKLPIHRPKNVDRYITDIPSKSLAIDVFRRLGHLDIYQQNHIILNEGIKVGSNSNLQIKSSFVDYKSAYSKGIVGISSLKNNDGMLKIITLFLNSSFVRYYVFLVTSSLGIERDVVKYKELFQVPFILDNLSDEEYNTLIKCFNNIKQAKEQFNDISLIVDGIDNFIINKIGYSNAIDIIKDTLLNIDLFQKQDNSEALSPIPIEYVKIYVELLCFELNDFLEDQSLYINGTVYSLNRNIPLMLVKISLESTKQEIKKSAISVDKELTNIDRKLWEEKGGSIYFRKRVNYYNGNDIYIIRPNQRRFWTRTMAMEDASELILEILNKD